MKRHTTRAKNRTETRTLLAATLACYLTALACVLGVTYSLAALAAPGLPRAGVTIQAEARP